MDGEDGGGGAEGAVAGGEPGRGGGAGPRGIPAMSAMVGRNRAVSTPHAPKLCNSGGPAIIDLLSTE